MGSSAGDAERDDSAEVLVTIECSDGSCVSVPSSHEILRPASGLAGFTHASTRTSKRVRAHARAHNQANAQQANCVAHMQPRDSTCGMWTADSQLAVTGRKILVQGKPSYALAVVKSAGGDAAAAAAM